MTDYEEPARVSSSFRTHPTRPDMSMPELKAISLTKTSVTSGVGAARGAFYFQFVTTPTSDTEGTTILLHFNNKRYLFGHVSEGTQRACTQRGVGLRKIRNIFLTGRTSWRTTGGLIGMILSASDVQSAESEGSDPSEKPRLDIYGAPKLLHSMACARRFVFRKGMPVSITEFEDRTTKAVEEPDWADENIQVWVLPTWRKPSGHHNPDGPPASNPSPTTSPKSPRKRSHDEFQDSEDKSPRLTLDPGDQALRRQVVTDMFGSDWSFDNLIETPLNEVKLPATLFVRDLEEKKLIQYVLPKADDPQPPPGFKVLVRAPWPAALRGKLPPATLDQDPPAVSYIVRGHAQRGVFDPKKAIALGVPMGPLWRELTSGKSLELKDGRVVTPDMVLGPKKLGKGIAIIDLQWEDQVEGLVSRPEWRSEQITKGITAICWILGPAVVNDDRLQTFMKSMPSTKHIIASPDVCPDYLAMDSSAASAIRLSRISSAQFPVPIHNNRPVSDALSTQLQGIMKKTFLPAQRGLTIDIEPKFQIREDENASFLDTAKVIKDIPQKVHDLAREARREIANSNGIVPLACAVQSPEIITLGTGSSMPSKYRNVSATLLRIPSYGNYLFDCGEDTLGQLARIFSPAELDNVLRDLRFIWISHLHADHHLGTLSVLLRRNAVCGRDKRSATSQQNILYLASEASMKDFVDEYRSVEALPDVVNIVCSSDGIYSEGGERFQVAHSGLHIEQLRLSRVTHCLGAQAISITFEGGFKFSYSGDCRPSAHFAHIGRGSDVLVHEATFDDDMEGDALAKRHCTTGEALGVASRMGAKNVILTHFSQRYQKIPNMSNVKLPENALQDEDNGAGDSPATPTEKNTDITKVAEGDSVTSSKDANLSTPEAAPEIPLEDMNVCVAFDYMRVRVPDIKHMRKFTPAMMALFESEAPEKTAPAGFTEQESAQQNSSTQEAKKADMLARGPTMGRAPTKTKEERMRDRDLSRERNIHKRRASLQDWIKARESENRISPREENENRRSSRSASPALTAEQIELEEVSRSPFV